MDLSTFIIYKFCKSTFPYIVLLIWYLQLTLQLKKYYNVEQELAYIFNKIFFDILIDEDNRLHFNKLLQLYLFI
mgnify:CR=1 FL=1